MSKGKGRAGRPDQQVYAHALPLVPVPSTTLFARSLNLIRLHLVSIENPHCVGIFDEPSRSVWIVNARDRDILWRRGFFGKGNLSRSEPSWLNRRLNQLGGAKGEFSFF
jgi:tRNA-splicing endonuclease subunit Sen2